MKFLPIYRHSVLFLMLSIGLFSFGCKKSIKEQNKSINFNKGWEFVKVTDTTVSPQFFKKSNKTLLWENVNLPHTANIEPLVTVKTQWQGTCIYRKFFDVPYSYKDKHVAIKFEAAMQDAYIYINGSIVYHHVGGYLPFYINISEYIQLGKENSILVKLNNEDNPTIPPGKPLKTLDFNIYSGIYRNVNLILKDKIYISDAVSSTTEAGGGTMVWFDHVSKDSAKINVKTEIQNDLNENDTINLKTLLIDNHGDTIAIVSSAKEKVFKNASISLVATINVSSPQLWSPDEPNLNTVIVQLIHKDKLIDEVVQRIGIRELAITAQDGVVLNGVKIKIRGTNRHQEYPYIGYSLSDNAQYRDAFKISQAGFNFVRCSHYPPAPAFLDACDELGILVMNSIPGWQFVGNDTFQQNSLKDVRDMVRRDRNHPSIILWEASLNETGMPKEYMEKAHKIVHAELPFKGIYTCGWLDDTYDVFIPARQHAKAPDYWKKYNKNKPILIAEYGDWEYYAQNAGFNQTEFSDLKDNERSSRQLREYGQNRLAQQALNYQEAHNDNLAGNALGDANWLMFDYNRGYSPDIESSGIMDIFRLPKFSFYFYQSQAEPNVGVNKPMVFIANYWNDSLFKNVLVYSNCQEVELFLNGKSLGRNKPMKGKYSGNLLHPPFEFQIDKFEPGKLVAKGYLDGKVMAEYIQETPGTPFSIRINVDTSGKPVQAGCNDVVFIYAYIVDQKGNIVPENGNEKVVFSIEGDGQLIGNNPANVIAGIATILLRVGEKPGIIKITAKTETITEETIDLIITN